MAEESFWRENRLIIIGVGLCGLLIIPALIYALVSVALESQPGWVREHSTPTAEYQKVYLSCYSELKPRPDLDSEGMPIEDPRDTGLRSLEARRTCEAQAQSAIEDIWGTGVTP